MPDVVLITGLPASGKYTVAAELVRQMEERNRPTKLVDNHYVNNVIFPLISAEGQSSLPREVWDRVGEVSATVLGTIEELSPPDWNFVFTAYISGVDDEWYVHRIGALAEKRDSGYTVVELTCDVDELARRVSTPDRVARHKMTSEPGIREYFERGTPPIDRPDVLRIDTTALAPEVAAAKISDRLQPH